MLKDKCEDRKVFTQWDNKLKESKISVNNLLLKIRNGSLAKYYKNISLTALLFKKKNSNFGCLWVGELCD